MGKFNRSFCNRLQQPKETVQVNGDRENESDESESDDDSEDEDETTGKEMAEASSQEDSRLAAVTQVWTFFFFFTPACKSIHSSTSQV